MYRLAACAAALGALFASPPAERPHTSYWSADENTVDAISEIRGTFQGGGGFAPARVGKGFAFDGVDDALTLPDDERLRFTKSITIRAWIKCNAYPPENQSWGQIVFRGDEHGGRDPYFLAVRHDGTLTFAVNSASSESGAVQAPFPLGRFVRVTATLDDNTGLMRLMYGERVVAETVTPVRPLRDLDPGANAGVSIGNHAGQPHSAYNMPFRGIVDDLTLSNRTTLALEALSLGAPDPAGTTGTVLLQVPAPPEGARVTLTGSDARVPEEVVVAPGKRSARFRITASPNAERLTVTGSYNGSSVTAERCAAP